MSGTDTSNALSHILVAGSTLWCIYHTNRGEGWRWIYGTYGSLCFYSFVGIWRYGNPRYGDDSQKLYDFSFKCIQCFTLSCAVNHLYLQYGIEFQYAIIHTVVPCIPLAMYLTRDDWEEDLIDLIVLGNIISCLAISIAKENHYGVALALNFGLCHFPLRQRVFFDVPAKILYNVGLCFCVVFAYKAIRDVW